MSIDNRIVQLQFNNREFESRVQDSLISLDKLKKGLDLSSSTAALESLNKESNKIDMSKLATSIETITNRLSNMGLIGIFALQRITNSAIDTGIALAKSMSIGPISSGWSKYEEKTGSVQTLVNSTGLSVEEVNKHLDKLMWFSDETSYGFTDMTKALSTMVTSGGDIKKLIPMIQGVANSTAFAGKGAQEFSRIMYNLNQSYSAGFLNYMDWRSVELQGGNSKALVQTIIDTGVAMNKIKKGSVTLDNFSTSLQERWVDRSVMEKAFGYFSSITEKAYEMVNAGEVDTATEAYEILAKTYDNVAMRAARSAQEAKSFSEAISATRDAVSSGWMNTFEIIFGNYEEAKKLWTDLAYTLWDIFASGASARNALLTEWKELGGRDKMLEGIGKIYKNIVNVVSVIQRSFQEFFPPITVVTLTNITDAFVKLTDYMTISNYNLADLKKGFTGIFAILSAVWMGVKNLAKWFGQLVVFMEPAIDSIFKWFAYFGDLGVALADFLKTSPFLADTFKSIQKYIGPIIPTLVSFYKEIEATVIGLLSLIDIRPALETTLKFLSNIFGSLLDGVSPALSGFNSFINGLSTSMAEFRNNETSKFKEFINSLSNLGNPFLGLYAFFTKIFSWLKEAYMVLEPYLKVAADAVMNIVGGIIKVFKDAFTGMTAESFIKVINGFLKAGLLIALTDLTKKIKQVVSGDADVPIVSHLVGVLKEIKNSLVSWQDSLIPSKIMDIAKALIIVAVAVGILSMIDPARLDKALAAITILFIELVGSIKLMNMSISNDDLTKLPFMATTMITMGIAILLLASALKKIASLKEDELHRGIIAIGAFAGLIAVTYNSMKTKAGDVISGDALLKMSIGLIAFAYALKQVANVAVTLGSINYLVLGQGLVALGAILFMIYTFLEQGDKSFTKLNPDMGAGLMLFAIAIRVIASAVINLGQLDVVKLGLGLGAIATIMAGVVLMINHIGKDATSFAGSAVGIAIIAASLYILAGAVALLGVMPLDVLRKGVGSIIILLTMLSGALVVAKDSEKGALGILGIVLALNMLIPSLIILGAMPIDVILKGLGALFAILVILVNTMTTAGAIFTTLGPGLLMFTGAMLMLGAAVYLTGAGFIALAAGLVALAAAWAVSGKVLIQMARDMATILPEVIEAFIVGIFRGIAVIFTEFSDMVIQLLVIFFGGIFKLFFELVSDFINNLYTLIEPAVKFVIHFVDTFLKEMAAKSPSMIQSAFDIIKAWLDGIEANLGAIIDKGIKVVIAFVNGVADGVRNNREALGNAVMNLVKTFIDVIFGGLGDLVVSGGTAVGSFMSGFLKAIFSALGGMAKGAWDLITTFISTIFNLLKNIVGIANDVIKSFVDGVKNAASSAANIKKLIDVGKDMIDGFIQGIKDKASDIVKAAVNVMDGAVDGIKKFLGIKSPSLVAKEIGTFFDEGLIKGFLGMKKQVGQSAASLGDTVVNSLSKSLSLIQIPEDDLTPVIKPVLDMENFNADLKNLKKDVKNGNTLDVSTTKNEASDVYYRNNKKDFEIGQNGSGSGSGSTTYNVKLDGVYYIREEADIKKLSQELAIEIERQRRA